MKHYPLSQWTDFARRVTTAEQNEQMQKHLDSCQRCKSAVKAFESLADLAQRESAYDAPESAVRIAQSYFAPMRVALPTAKQVLVGLLTFDSSQGVVAEGFRAMQDAPRQLLYVSGNTVVDLRIEADPGSGRMVLGGQVLPSRRALTDQEVIQVLLLSGTETIATTATNQFGEFHMSLKAAKHLQLLFELTTGTLAVQVPES